jgi:hypothetical protein
MMSRLAGFYIATAVQSLAAGTTTAAASRLPPRRAGDHAAGLDAIGAHHRGPGRHRVAGAVRRLIRGPDTAQRREPFPHLTEPCVPQM